MRKMYTNRFNTKGSDQIGHSAEELFVKLAKDKGWTVIAATKKQDYYEHWDYIIRKPDVTCYIEVKGMKRLNRNITQDDSQICIELMGNAGYPGWIYGKSTHIAFLMKEGFVLVDRKKLVEKVESLVDINQEPKPSKPQKDLHVIYRRVAFGHKDKIVYITKEELLTVPHKIWEVENV